MPNFGNTGEIKLKAESFIHGEEKITKIKCAIDLKFFKKTMLS